MPTTQYEPQRLFKRFSMDLRQKLFEKIALEKGVEFNIDWNTVTMRNVTAMTEALNALPYDTRDQIDAILLRINLTGSVNSCVSTIHGILSKNEIVIPDDSHTWSTYDIALWAYLNVTESIWDEITQFVRIDHYSERSWTRMQIPLPPEATPINNEETLSKLRDAVSEFVHKNEMRGDHGQCDFFARKENGLNYYILSMNDHATVRTQWDNGVERFEEETVHDAFEVIFAYDFAKNEVHVHYQGDTKKKHELCRIWTNVMFGSTEALKFCKVEYQIQQFSDPTKVSFETDLSGGILSARLLSLCFSPIGELMSRYFLTSDADVYSMIDKNMKNGFASLKDMFIRKVGIDIEYIDPLSRKTKHCALNITPTSSNHLNFPPEIVSIISQFMKTQGILYA